VPPDPKREHTVDNTDEIRFWNRRGGSQWRDHQSHFDTLFSGVTERLLGYAATRPGESVMDIGCGSGDTTARLAKAVGPAGCVTAIDVSVPLLSAAHSRIEAHHLTNVELCEADAQTMALSARADAIVSRFGVMFFSDPVAAFANLRAHTRAGGRLAVAAWGAFEDNPWFSWPFEVATDVLGPVPPRDPRSPGPTAFGDADYVLDILSAAGGRPRAGVACLQDPSAVSRTEGTDRVPTGRPLSIRRRRHRHTSTSPDSLSRQSRPSRRV